MGIQFPDSPLQRTARDGIEIMQLLRRNDPHVVIAENNPPASLANSRDAFLRIRTIPNDISEADYLIDTDLIDVSERGR